MNLNVEFARAVEAHQKGRLADADAGYRRVLRKQPRHPDAIHLTGVIALQRGQYAAAVERIERAVALNAKVADYFSNLGLAYQGMGSLNAAAKSLRQAVSLNPNFAVAWNNLGSCLEVRGELDEAVVCLERALRLIPNYADAWHNLGLVRMKQGDFAKTEEALRRALQVKPDYAKCHSTLGLCYLNANKLDEAEASLREAVRLEPRLAEAWNNLGIICFRQGRPDAAIEATREALRVRPDYPSALNNLGNCLREGGSLQEAEQVLRRALELDPQYAEARNNLGLCLRAKGDLEEAVAELRRAIELRPDYPAALNNLGLCYQDQGVAGEAIACYNRALQVRPDYYEAANNLGFSLVDAGKISEAKKHLFHARDLAPEKAGVWMNLGNAFLAEGRSDLAVPVLQKATQIMPDENRTHSNLCYAINLEASRSTADISAIHQAWWERHGSGAERFREIRMEPLEGRRLRVGLISPDFRHHSVSHFMTGLLEHGDREKLTYFCYSDAVKEDWVTEKVRGLAGHWHRTAGWKDEQLGRQIIADRIDILVDLAGHTAGNRMLLFARKPAPVQVSYLGYPNATGLPTIDFRLTDGYADPETSSDRLSGEALIRLHPTAWCFDPIERDVPVTDRTQDNPEVVFGCFNNLAKFNRAWMEVWARILQRVPGSKLFLKAKGFLDEGVRQEWAKVFAGHGVKADRLHMRGWARNYKDHLGLYGQVDIALDTFPYCGTTTTCEALWMGVPVLTLAGDRHASRVGVSLLTNAGLPEMIAGSPDLFVEKAVELASDRARLAELRRTLRGRLEASPLMQPEAFARSFENALSKMAAARQEGSGLT